MSLLLSVMFWFVLLLCIWFPLGILKMFNIQDISATFLYMIYTHIISKWLDPNWDWCFHLLLKITYGQPNISSYGWSCSFLCLVFLYVVFVCLSFVTNKNIKNKNKCSHQKICGEKCLPYCTVYAKKQLHNCALLYNLSTVTWKRILSVPKTPMLGVVCSIKGFLSQWKLKSFYWKSKFSLTRKISSFFSFFEKYVTPNYRTMGSKESENNFSLYRGILSLHKCTWNDYESLQWFLQQKWFSMSESSAKKGGVIPALFIFRRHYIIYYNHYSIFVSNKSLVFAHIQLHHKVVKLSRVAKLSRE